MTPYYDKNGITVYQGDLREVLPQLSERFDCVCTDAPYGLGFMGQGWDHCVPGREYWEIISRSCKPGAMLLSFGGTRTFHRMMVAIEDAGWEIRDCLMWLYGSGFPKSLDIAKAIDKQAGVKREVIGVRDVGPDIRNDNYGRNHGGRMVADITVPATELAKRWDGWSTALKPSWEPVVMAMTPLDGTFANNALEHGVAGINIDACRVGDNPGYKYNADRNGTTFHGQQGERIKQSASKKGSEFIESTKGRWPANLILDEEAGRLLDKQSGVLKSGVMKAGQRRISSKGGGGYHGNFPDQATAKDTYGDSGGASRFYYCAKSSKKERGAFNNHPTVKPLALMKYLLTLCSTPTGGLILDPFAGSGTTALAAKQLGRPCVCIELEEQHCEIIAKRLDSQ